MSDIKKQKILSAAKECLSRYGYEKTTLSDIGKMVGLNKASLYYYYKNKEEILTEVVFNETVDFISSLQAKIKKEDGYKNKIINYFKNKKKYFDEVIHLHNLSIESMQKVLPMFNKLYNIVIEKEVSFLNELLIEAKNNKEIITCDTKRVAQNILTICDGYKQKNQNQVDSRESCSDCLSDNQDEFIFTVGMILDGLKRQ